VVRISEELFEEVKRYAEPLVDNFESALWKALRLAKSTPDKKVIAAKQRKPRTRATGELTSQDEFRKPILEALVEKGDRASREEVHKAVERKMKDLLKTGNYELNRDGTTKLEKGIDYARLKLVHDGLLKRGSPRGIWEITEEGKQWLSSHRKVAMLNTKV
jgi:hypothetical protein